MRATDSPRWCATCKAWGNHHTDRHGESLAASPTLTIGDIDRLIAHAAEPDLIDDLLDARNGDRPPNRKPHCQCPQRAHDLHRYGCKWAKEDNHGKA